MAKEKRILGILTLTILIVALLLVVTQLGKEKRSPKTKSAPSTTNVIDYTMEVEIGTNNVSFY